VGGHRRRREEPCHRRASILAKVTRDAMMDEQARSYPLYGFEHNKGYATPEHFEALRVHGPCDIHRRASAPSVSSSSFRKSSRASDARGPPARRVRAAPAGRRHVAGAGGPVR